MAGGGNNRQQQQAPGIGAAAAIGAAAGRGFGNSIGPSVAEVQALIGQAENILEIFTTLIKGVAEDFDGKRDKALDMLKETSDAAQQSQAAATLRAKQQIIHERGVAIDAINTRLMVALATLSTRPNQPSQSADNPTFHKDEDSGHMAPNG